MKDNNNTPTRRNVLKMIGGTASAVGMTGVASAKEQQIGRLERWRILNSNKVQKIYEEVNRPKIRSTKKIEGDVEGTTGTLYRFLTDIGELRHIIYDGYAVSQFVFATVQEQVTYRKKPHSAQDDEWAKNKIKSSDGFNSLKRKYGKIFQVPSTIYTDDEEDIAYAREVTEREQSELATATGVDDSDAEMVYSTDAGGFVVNKMAKDSSEKIMVVTPQEGLVRSSTESSLAHANVEQKDVSAQGCNELACFDCGLAAFTGVVGCIGVCATSAITGIAAIVICIGCAIGAGIVVSAVCYRCYRTCK